MKMTGLLQVAEMTNLRRLDCNFCDHIENIEIFFPLRKLVHLDLRHCKRFNRIVPNEMDHIFPNLLNFNYSYSYY